MASSVLLTPKTLQSAERVSSRSEETWRTHLVKVADFQRLVPFNLPTERLELSDHGFGYSRLAFAILYDGVSTPAILSNAPHTHSSYKRNPVGLT